jgi:S-adenosylmethionine/arginine decarboxylase-like enzyme
MNTILCLEELPDLKQINESMALGDYFGISLIIDLKQCNFLMIKNISFIRDYIVDLCNIIDMTRVGDPLLLDYGESPEIAGISFLQLIETSSITGHFVNKSRNGYIDIFTCKAFDPIKAVEFTCSYFDAGAAHVSATLRGK